MLNHARAVFLGILLAVPFNALAQPGTLPAVPLNPPPNAPWFNTSLPVEQRAEALVSQMTLDEKGKQLVNRAGAIRPSCVTALISFGQGRMPAYSGSIS